MVYTDSVWMLVSYCNRYIETHTLAFTLDNANKTHSGINSENGTVTNKTPTCVVPAHAVDPQTNTLW